MNRPLRLVVVDDPLATARSLVSCLEAHGYGPEVREAQSPSALATCVSEAGCDVLIVSALHPDGLAEPVLTWARQHVPDVPVILVAPGEVAADDPAVLSAMQAGARDYIGSDDRSRFAGAIARETSRTARASATAAESSPGEILRDQMRLQGMQKMEAVGRLAGGIAHDFNNLVQAMTGHTEVLLRTLPPDNARRQNAEGIRRAGERAGSLTRQLLAFSRQQVLLPRELDLNEAVGNVELLLKRSLGEDVQLRLQLAGDLAPVFADATQLEHVLMNLVSNARDATPPGGTVTIETANATLRNTDPGLSFSLTEGSYAMLSVSDTGSGMTPDVRARAFEPFFTTKELGRGTGLGLSTVYGIVKQSDGYVWVDSEEGAGTRVRVYLPRLEPRGGRGPSRVRGVSSRQGAETLLVVEDESVVRELIEDWLRSHGYRVLAAGNGLEALDVCAQHEGEIDLIVADVVMPRMGGPALVQQLAPVRPDLKVIYMSGYADDALGDRRVLDSGTPFLQKPFSLDALVEKVRTVLDTP